MDEELVEGASRADSGFCNGSRRRFLLGVDDGDVIEIIR
jgi:hypothetical protein